MLPEPTADKKVRFADAATIAELGAFAATARGHGHRVSTRGASSLVEEVAALIGCSNALGLPRTPTTD